MSVEYPPSAFSAEQSAGRTLIVCVVGEHRGAARVFSAGEQDAKDRAEAQARAKWAAAQE